MNNKDSSNETTVVPFESEVPATVRVEESRAVQEVQAGFIMAKRFPRDLNAVFTRIIESCKRPLLAEQAMYKYPRGGQVVTGPSIRLAEVLAQNYGNLEFGVRELERRNGVSKAISFCLDKETNTRKVLEFDVEHEIEVGKKGEKRKKRLTDPRDIYELVANNGARRMRACILAIIPGDIVDAAVRECRRTVAKGGGEPMADRIRKMTVAFKDVGVSQEMLEEKLGHKIDITTGEEIADLTSMFTSIRDKQAKRGDFFKFPEDDENDSAAITDKIKKATALTDADKAEILKEEAGNGLG